MTGQSTGYTHFYHVQGICRLRADKDGTLLADPPAGVELLLRARGPDGQILAPGECSYLRDLIKDPASGADLLFLAIEAAQEAWKCLQPISGGRFSVGVNASAADIALPWTQDRQDFLDRLKRANEGMGGDRGDLRIEVTELVCDPEVLGGDLAALVGNIPRFAAVAQEIKKKTGVTVVPDDLDLSLPHHRALARRGMAPVKICAQGLMENRRSRAACRRMMALVSWARGSIVVERIDPQDPWSLQLAWAAMRTGRQRVAGQSFALHEPVSPEILAEQIKDHGRFPWARWFLPPNLDTSPLFAPQGIG